MEAWPDVIDASFLTEMAPSWLASMQRLDKRMNYAWPHAENEGVETFRLDEHVWIWRALKSLEIKGRQELWAKIPETELPPKHADDTDGQLGVPSEGDDVSERSLTCLSKDGVPELRTNFASDFVRSQVLRQFTTKSDALPNPTLAVTRSSRQTRYMFHARDTALFYDEMLEFFSGDSSTEEPWRNTIKCQMRHDENQDSGWEYPLRYALSIMIGARQSAINDKSPDEMVRTAADVLFSSSSVNGFFPGRIEALTKSPVEVSSIAEEHRDSYYHASFEIPYILFTHMERVSNFYGQSTIITKSSKPIQNQSLGDNIRPQGSISIQHLGEAQRDASSNLDVFEILRRPRNRQGTTIKKVLAFNTLIDSEGIETLHDEWLLELPQFIMRNPPSDYGSSLKALEARFPAPDVDRYEMLADVNIVRSVGKGERKIRQSEFSFSIVDIPCSKLLGGKAQSRHGKGSRSDGEFEEVLKSVRTARHAEKRLLHLTMATRKAAACCCAANKKPERVSLIEFFKKHFEYAKHAMDKNSMLDNSWETEVHLSYYRHLDTLSDVPESRCRQLPGGRGKSVVHMSVSFRFSGDVFDRYWTGYLLEYVSFGPITSEGMSFPSLGGKGKLGRKGKSRRRVIEQSYLATILSRVQSSSNDIWTGLEKDSKIDLAGLFSNSTLTYSKYASWSKTWQEYEPIMQLLQEDLTSTLHLIDTWEARKEETRRDVPGWCQEDEEAFRADIARNEHRISREKTEIKNLRDQIKLSRALCQKRLDRARDELSFRSDQNIAMFTYVTVVFLPLGFTASIFSMSGSPERSLAINMVVASFIALAVTILALMNAKGLAGIADSISTSVKDLTDDAKRSSVLIRDRQNVEDKGTTFKGGDPKPPHLRVSSTDAIPWDLVFWTGYIFIELPSRSITAAWSALGWPRYNRQDKKGLVGAVAHEIARGVRMCLGSGEDSAGDPEMNHSSSKEPVAESAAQTNMDATDQQRRDKHEYFKTTARVLLGFFTVPLFLPLWVLQILCFYAWDTLALLGGTTLEIWYCQYEFFTDQVNNTELLRQGISHISLPDSKGSESRLMTNLTKPPEKLRLMKTFKNYLQLQRNLRESTTNAGSRKESGSPREKTS